MAGSEKALIGAAGEYYILFQLLRRGLHASLAPQNAYAADIVVFGPSMSEGFMVQVKTRTSPQGQGWVMSAKHEGIVHPRLFYAFLDLSVDVPVTFLMPSSVVADVVARSHSSWLAIPGRDGREHKDSNTRRLAPGYSHQVPGLAPDWMERHREDWGLLTHAIDAVDPEP